MQYTLTTSSFSVVTWKSIGSTFGGHWVDSGKRKLYGRLHKCEFLKDQVEYLGFEVGPRGIQASPGKVKAIIEWPRPKGVHDVRSFLGLASYYRRFVRGFSEMARPLTQLTRAGVEWEWSTAQHQAFNQAEVSSNDSPSLEAP